MNEQPLDLEPARVAPINGVAASGMSLESRVLESSELESSAMGTDERMLSVWREWLNALATDAEAAHAAAIAYKDLDSSAREVWLEALSHDASELGVPIIAVYGPLLAVESDPSRCLKMQTAIGAAESTIASSAALYALSGVDRSGVRVVAIVIPLYLNFVQVLACGYQPGQRFEWVRHDPILLLEKAPKAGTLLGDTLLEPAPLKALIDELAHTVLGHRRGGAELPPALEVLSDLFAPILDDGAPEAL